jgi:hypothetical protein
LEGGIGERRGVRIMKGDIWLSEKEEMIRGGYRNREGFGEGKINRGYLQGETRERRIN